MKLCLYCQEVVETRLTWATLWAHEGDKLLCQKCESHLHVIQEEHCPTCCKVNVQSKCTDCIQWQKYFDGKDPLDRNISLYSYNQWMKDVIAEWKYKGDYVIGEIFKKAFYELFTRVYHDKIKESVVLSIPLSKDRLYERGFNQAAQLASFLTQEKLEENEYLLRATSEKQAKKTRQERLRMENPFQLTKTINKSVILVDDIYTTGRTLRHVATLLKEQGCPKVYACTLVRT